MKRVMLLVFVLLCLAGCREPDYTFKNEEIEEKFTHADFFPYVRDVNYETREKLERGSNYDYSVTVMVTVNNDFDDIETKEKLSMMGSFYKNYLVGEVVECGSPYCRIQGMTLYTDDNEYALVREEDAYNGYPSLLINGEERYTWNQLREDNSRMAKEEEQKKREQEIQQNGVTNDEIYMYMKQAYDSITNFGESYIPEVHDPMVAQMASQKFGISEQLADQIYIEKEIGY